jgi:hypothetical protein
MAYIWAAGLDDQGESDLCKSLLEPPLIGDLPLLGDWNAIGLQDLL